MTGEPLEQPQPSRAGAVSSAARADRAAVRVWLTLVLLTLATYLAGRAGLGGGLVVLLLFLSVTVKGQLLAEYFMGLKRVRWPWRGVVSGWLLTVVALIGFAYWLGER
jgi:cytochrome c oxidase subunit 4